MMNEADSRLLADKLAAVEEARNVLHWTITDLRQDGRASWADVGAALGITRQAAQQRFGTTVEHSDYR